MVQYRYLGYGVTDEKGIAKLDHDPQGRAIEHSYTGSGAGLVDIVASLDSEITGSSLVSETFVVIDAIFKDIGTKNDYGNWSVWTGYEPLLTRTDEYTSIKVDTENGKTDARRYKTMTLSEFAIEFDMLLKSNADTDVFATIRNNWSVLGNISLNRFNLSLNNWHHIKMVYDGSTVVVTNKTNSTSHTYPLSNTFERFLFQIGSSSEELQYKNFVIYPI